MIHDWIVTEELPPVEIAVLVSKQPELYAELLMQELEQLGIPFRNEQKLQDISVEPVSRLIVDFMTVLYGSREPDAYLRLMNLLIEVGFDENDQSVLRADWQRYLQQERTDIFPLTEATTGIDHLWGRVLKFIRRIGRARLISLSADYEQGSRLSDLVKETKERITELLMIEPNVVKALSRFSYDQAVRIMTIHKSKGLEFDSVIMLGIEKETFWGKEKAERNSFFVGISRAKRRLVLTSAAERPTPTGYTKKWDIRRRRHEEFLGYAERFLASKVECD
ncbi:MAG TPA: 3'-5' exonuclease [Geobacteraceae bacterium]